MQPRDLMAKNGRALLSPVPTPNPGSDPPWQPRVDAMAAGRRRRGIPEERRALLPHLSLEEQGLVTTYAGFVREVRDLPGVIVEMGVSRGATLMIMAREEARLRPHVAYTRVYGFDTFTGFPNVSDRDGGIDPTIDRVPGGYTGNSTLAALQEVIADFDIERPYGDVPMIELIEGDITATVPKFVQRFQSGNNRPTLPIKLLHIDCDLYEPTRAALTALTPLLVPGALVLLDEWGWGSERWPGEIAAVREIFDGYPLDIKQADTPQPGGWFKVTEELYRAIHSTKQFPLLADYGSEQATGGPEQAR